MRYSFDQRPRRLSWSAACVMAVLQPITTVCAMAQGAPLVDSSGVRIFTFSAAGKGERALRLTDAPTIRLKPTPNCELYRVTSLLALREGELGVANSGNSELCFFGGGGTFLRKSGRRGAGPGEFRELTVVQRTGGDSILVYDGTLRRFSFLKPDGSFVRTIALSPPPGVGGSITLVVALLDGTLLVGYSEIAVVRPSPAAQNFSQAVFRYDATGKLLGSVGRFHESEHFVQEVPPQRGGVAYWNLAFGRRLTVLAVADGFVAGDGSEGAISFYSHTGRLTAEYRSDEVARPVSTSDIEAYRRSELAKASAEERAMEQRRVMEMPYPAVYPAYRRFLIDPMKRVWLERYPRPNGSVAEWTVWDPASIRPSRLIMPLRFRPRAISAESVCGVTLSQDDEETVVCYGIILPRPSR